MYQLELINEKFSLYSMSVSFEYLHDSRLQAHKTPCVSRVCMTGP